MATGFWSRQEKARSRTGLMVFFFALAMWLLVVAIYFLVALITRGEFGSWGNPGLFLIVSLVMLGIIGMDSLGRLAQLSAIAWWSPPNTTSSAQRHRAGPVAATDGPT